MTTEQTSQLRQMLDQLNGTIASLDDFAQDAASFGVMYVIRHGNVPGVYVGLAADPAKPYGAGSVRNAISYSSFKAADAVAKLVRNGADQPGRVVQLKDAINESRAMAASSRDMLQQLLTK